MGRRFASAVRRGLAALGAATLAAAAGGLFGGPARAGEAVEGPGVDPGYQALESLVRSFVIGDPLITPAVMDVPPAPPLDPFTGDPVGENFFPQGQPDSLVILDAVLPVDQAATLFGPGGPGACDQPHILCPPTDSFFGPDPPPSDPFELRVFGFHTTGDIAAPFDGIREFAFAFDTPAGGEWQQQVAADAFHLTDCAVILRATRTGELELDQWTPQGFVEPSGPLRVVRDSMGVAFLLGPGHPCYESTGFRSMSFAARMGERRPGYVASYLHPDPNAEVPLTRITESYVLDLTATAPAEEPGAAAPGGPPGPGTTAVSEGDGFPFGVLLAAGIPITLGGGATLAYDRGRRRIESQGRRDEVNFMQVFLEGFSRSGREAETAALDTAFHVATERERLVQHRLEQEYERLASTVGAAYADYVSAMQRFQSAYVHALSGSTELQGLLRQFAEARGIAQRQDLAFAVVLLVRGLGTLAYRGVQWARTGPTAGAAAEGGTGAAGAAGAAPLAATQVPGWVATANRMRANAQALQGVRGWHDIFVHGSRLRGFIFQEKATGRWRSLNVRWLAQRIRQTPGYREGMPIRLFSCHSATNGTAAALARQLNTWVAAPTERIWLGSRNFIQHDGGGFTILFGPNGVARYVIVRGAKVPLVR